MTIRPNPHARRRGATILEFSLALPILLMLTLGTTVLALAVSQFQMVAMLAREGARWASVHGLEYQQATGKPAGTAADVYGQAILPRAASMNLPDLTYSVTWSPDNKAGSTVSVTVKYHSIPSVYLSPIDVSSTSIMSVSY